MSVLLLIACAIAPGVSLMSFFYLRDLYEAEPLKLVGLLFFLGMVAAFPIMYLVHGMDADLATSPYLHAYFGAALVEELLKYALTFWFAVRNREFNEEYDGIVYAVAASLGFATVENIVKVLTFGWETVPVRALLTVPGHALFGVLMGYSLGKAKFAATKSKRMKLYVLAFVTPWLLHGTFDSLLLSKQTLVMILVVPFMIWLWITGLRKVRAAQERSPFKPVEKTPDV